MHSSAPCRLKPSQASWAGQEAVQCWLATSWLHPTPDVQEPSTLTYDHQTCRARRGRTQIDVQGCTAMLLVFASGLDLSAHHQLVPVSASSKFANVDAMTAQLLR